jgi:flagellar biosynthesis protein FlhB
MAEDDDKDSKTEEPSQRRLEEARKKGQVPFSREVPNFMLLALFTLLIAAYLPGMGEQTVSLFKAYIENAHLIALDNGSVRPLLWRVLMDGMSLIVLPFLAAMAVAVLAGFMQIGFNLSSEPLAPKLEKISIIKGFNRIFSMRSVMEFLKGIIKISVVGIVAFWVIQGQVSHVLQIIDDEVIVVLMYMLKLAVRVMIGVCIVMFFVALLDLIYQRLSYMKNLRMSKHELKEEYKQQEGDPKIKQKLRQIRMERAKKRMMQSVPGADVVVTNPTHFAVALKYEGGAMQAPKVVAKGQDFIALTIRRIAEENDVPIVENPPLARALFDNVEVDQEIPVQHYKAVAEIISYVYKLKGRMR